ncbi:ATP-grasp domain-containing protein [Mucilaginibacter sp. UR6-1]|uniref:ATP-grasp domain-containing protein n=1 Tax=Mucilaginibacter sp. UR6-1 TaxID=1435643 RepID=UPI001E60B0CB|nr:ATP-grasp domain-containing protein [Mucilaginibacter sp. UR6-1]MCC8410887.1 ATP-grasp domain-containing protein [Mucilaginibacter sp. UR6-1]
MIREKLTIDYLYPRIIRKRTYQRIKARTIDLAYRVKDRFLFPQQKYAQYSILLTKKGERRNEITSLPFKKLPIKLNFEEFCSDTNFAMYDLVIPMSVQDVTYCHAARNIIKTDLIPIPSLEAITICDKKDMLVYKLREAGLGHLTPSVHRSYPYILKKNAGDFSRNTFIINNKDDEKTFEQELNDPDYFTQELIFGKKEYASHIVFKNGKIMANVTVCHRYSERAYLQGKTTSEARNRVPNRHQEAFTQVLNAIGFEGLCCIDYKEVNGKPKIFEINPRFGGSLRFYFKGLLSQLR